MRSSRVDELGDRVLAVLDSGAGVARAAASVGLAEQTIRSWIRRGRLDPDGRFAPFACAIDRARRALPTAPDAPLPDRAELLRRLDRQSRDGSTRATELLLRVVEAHERPAGQLVDLARLRAMHAAVEAER